MNYLSLTELESSVIELESAVIELERSLIQLESSLIQLVRSLIIHIKRALYWIKELFNLIRELSISIESSLNIRVSVNLAFHTFETTVDNFETKHLLWWLHFWHSNSTDEFFSNDTKLIMILWPWHITFMLKNNNFDFATANFGICVLKHILFQEKIAVQSWCVILIDVLYFFSDDNKRNLYTDVWYYMHLL